MKTKFNLLILCIISISLVSCGRKVSEISSIQCQNDEGQEYSVDVSFPLVADTIFGKDTISALKLLDFYVKDLKSCSNKDGKNWVIDSIKIENILPEGNHFVTNAFIKGHKLDKDRKYEQHFIQKFEYMSEKKEIKSLAKPVHEISNLMMKTGKGELVQVDVRLTTNKEQVDSVFGTDSLAFENFVKLLFDGLKDECRYETTFVPQWIQSFEIINDKEDDGTPHYIASALCGGYAKNGFGVESEISDFIKVKFLYFPFGHYCMKDYEPFAW